jgi:uncharacterized protein
VDQGTSAHPEWPQNLDVTALLEEGWRPTPLREFVLKVHSRCNLACTYCYMYEMADQGWRRQPRRMSTATIDTVARRIAEHAHAHGLGQVGLVMHGGEPLLAGPDSLRHAVTAVRAAVGPEIQVNAGIQTNGVLLDATFLELFDELDIHVSVSLDGGKEDNDRHRRGADGRGSHERVSAGLERLTQPRFRHLFNGLLATIDLRNDPVATYESLLEFDPPTIDFLLPHGTWDTPPPGRSTSLDPTLDDSPYGDWLVDLFDRWYRAPVRETRVRLFNEIIRMVLGRPSRIEAIGLSAVALAVVETDGSIELVDSLKAAYEGASRTSLHVSRDTFDSALQLPSFAARQIGAQALSTRCRSCEVRQICGGGLYPHRYRSGSGFLNPSVYCRDLFRLISHVDRAVSKDLADLQLRVREEKHER